MEAVKIHPLDLFEILSTVNSDPVAIRLELLADGDPLIHYPGKVHQVDGVVYELTTAVPHKTTRFDDELRSHGMQPFHPNTTASTSDPCGLSNALNGFPDVNSSYAHQAAMDRNVVAELERVQPAATPESQEETYGA